MLVVDSVAVVLVGLAAVLNIYIYNYPTIHDCAWAPDAELRLLAFGDPQITGAGAGTTLRKRVDIRGNDMFLQHTASTLYRLLRPDAACVMGDLISSQWIDDLEFHRRADRYARIFSTDKLPVYNVSGNHDVGYHGEMTPERIDRFETRYGPVNLVREFGGERPWRVVAVNSLSLDGPPFDDKYTLDTRAFLERLESTPYAGETVLLTHVPLHKEAGVCRDGPYFGYYDDGALREQNHLSWDASARLLRSVFGAEGRGIILAGHDHVGCEAAYTVTEGGANFEHAAGAGNGTIPEITVRSMMGEYGGNGGLVSGVWDADKSAWAFEFSLCRFQVQHLWWATTIITYVTLTLVSVRALFLLLGLPVF